MTIEQIETAINESIRETRIAYVTVGCDSGDAIAAAEPFVDDRHTLKWRMFDREGVDILDIWSADEDGLQNWRLNVRFE